MYELNKYKRLSYLVMYSTFNNLAFRSVNGIYDFMHSSSCKITEGGTSICKDCDYSLMVKIQLGSCSIYQYLCIYLIQRLFSTSTTLDEAFRMNSQKGKAAYFNLMQRRYLKL